MSRQSFKCRGILSLPRTADLGRFCRDIKTIIATNFCELLPAFVATNFVMSRHNSSVSSGFFLIFFRDIVLLSQQCSTGIFLVLCRDKVVKYPDKLYVASLSTLFNISRDRVPIVVIFLLLFVLSFVATMVKFVTTFSISCLSQFCCFSC